MNAEDTLTWACDMCGDTRPDAKISVAKRDISQRYGLGPGSVFRNTRYCNDRPDCARRAKKGKRGRDTGKQVCPCHPRRRDDDGGG